MSNVARKLAWNTGVQVAARGASLALSLGTTMLLARHLGVAGYGSFLSVFVYMTLLTAFADWGTQTILVRDLAQEPEEAERQVGVALTVRLALALAAAVLAAATVPLFYRGQPQVLVGVLIALPVLLFGSLITTVGALFQARLKMGRVAAAEVAAQLLSTGCTAALVAAGRPLRELIAATVLLNGVHAALLLFLSRSLLAIRPRFDLALSLRLLRRAVPLGVALVLNTIYFRVDALIVSSLRGAGEMGYYGLAYRFVEALVGFGAIFVASTFPLLAAAAREPDGVRLRALTQRAFDVLVVVAAPATAGVVVLAPQLVRFVAGGSFDRSILVLRILIVGAGLMFVNGLLGHMLIALDRQRDALWLNVSTLVLNVGVNLALVPTFGAVGAAATATGSELFILGGALVLVRRYAGFVPAPRVSRRAAAATAAMAILLASLHLALPLALAAGVLAYAVSLWALRVHRGLASWPTPAAAPGER